MRKKHIKNRKKIILSLVILCIFSVLGTIKTLAAEQTFKLIDAVISDKSDTVDARIISFNNDDININSTFHRIDDFVSYKLIIKNTSSKNYMVKNIAMNNPNPYLEYSYETPENKIIKSGDEFEITIKAIYKKEVEDIEKRDTNETFKLTLDFADENGNEVKENITINPKTSDNIKIFMVLGTISFLGIILITKNKKIKKVMILTIVFVPLVTYAFQTSIVFEFDTQVKLRDKIVVKEIIDGTETIRIVPYNEKIEQPKEPEKEGYNFIGWYVGNEKYDFERQLQDDETIEAKYELIEYKIIYNLDGGTTSNNVTSYNIETETFDIENPTKEGYNFAGWTGSNGDVLQTKISISKGTTGDKTYTAHYSTRDDVTYKVIHKYENLDNTFETNEETLRGITNSSVKPQIKPRNGYENPEEKTITIQPNGSSVLTYEYKRKELEFSYSDITKVDLDNSTQPGTYKYGTTITAKAKNIEGYTFTKWNDNSVDINHTFTLIENTEISPEYSINTYTVTFEANNATTPNTITRNYNTKVGTLPTPVKDNYILDGWYKEGLTEKITEDALITDNITFYAKWGKSVNFAEIENENLSIVNQSTEQINITNSDVIGETYTYASNDLNIASVDQNGLVTANGIGTTKIIITGTTSNATKEINVTVTPRIYTVSFESEGGNSIDPIEVNEGETIETLPTPEKEGFDFDGWFTLAAGGEQLTTETEINETYTYHAHWTEHIDLLCRKATVLHHQECLRTDSKGCMNDGYVDSNNIVTFGNIVGKNTYKPGDAFDCDVNGNGQIDTDVNGDSIERFYYLRNVDENTAALLYYSNVASGEADNSVTLAYDSSNKNYNIPTALISNLPSKTSWNNTSLINSNIQVLNENNGTTANTDDLPIIDYSNYSSRMITLDDVKGACGVDVPTSASEVELPTTKQCCLFMFENTTYVNPNIKSGYWVATALSTSNSKIYRTVGSRHTVEPKEASSSTGSGIRPVIEVPLNKIEEPVISNTYTVSFDTLGGIDIDSMEVPKNTNIGTLPENPTKTDYTFYGWYTDTTYSEQVTEDTVITDNIVVYAKWISSTAAAEFNNKGYETITAAIAKTKKSEKATIKLLKNTEEKVSIPSERDIELNLNGYTISQTEDKNVIENSGTLKVFNGSLESTATTNAVINNKNGGILYIDNVNATHNGDRSALYNFGGGTVYIEGNSRLIANNDERASVMNLENGIMNVISATIESEYLPGIDNKGTLTIGTEDNIANKDLPIIKGKNYGVTTTTDISFFDGKIIGIDTDKAVNDLEKVKNIEENYHKVTDTEIISGITHKILYLDNE